jgi:hypothetical protein
MTFANPFPNLPIAQLAESLLPDFVLAFAFFTALTYAVLGKRFDHQRPAVVMSAAVGLALAAGLVWWEHDSGWSVRNVGPLAIGFAVILLGMVMYQAIHQVGGSWAGACIAVGASILVAWVLGFRWPVASEIIQVLAVVALTVGILAFLLRLHRRPESPGSVHVSSPQVVDVRHDMSDLYEDRNVGDRLGHGLDRLRQQAGLLTEHPEEGAQFMEQLRRVLPAEGWLAERMARLQSRACQVREGHAAALDETKHLFDRLPPSAKKKAVANLMAGYQEIIGIDTRLERLEQAVAENERRIKALTGETQAALSRYDYRKMADLLEVADKLQWHNEKLLKLIDRTERKLTDLAQRVASEARRVNGA